MRLIDAEELLIKLQWHCDLNCPYTEQERQKTDICDTCLLGDAKDYIDSMPTVEAVEVVRCNDCKYYEETDSRIGTCLLTISGAEVGGFCAWGEWRGDGDVV